MALAWTGVPVLAQSTNQTPDTTAPAQAPNQQPPADTTPAQTPDNTAPTDRQAPADGSSTPTTGTPADPSQAQPTDQGRPAAPTPGVRSGTVKLSDTVTLGGYGSARYELNNLEKPAPSGFDFRRFVLAADATPNDRLQLYSEIEFERLAEIEVERGVTRLDQGVAFAEDLEGGNGGEISLEQMWGQFKFSDAFKVRFGQILVPIGRFNINHDDDRWDIPRRTLVDRNAPIIPVKAAWTELGVGFTGSRDVGKSGQLTYQAYVVNGAIIDFAIEKQVESENGQSILKLASESAITRGPVNGEGGVRAGAWRVAYSPNLNLELGFSGYMGGYLPDFLDVNEKLDVDAKIKSFGADGLWKHGNLAIEGEYIHTDFGNTDRVIDAFIDTVTAETGVAPLPGPKGTETEFALLDLTPSRSGFWIEGRYRFWNDKWKNTFLGKGFDDPHLSAVFRYELATLKHAIEEVQVENGEIEHGDGQTLRQQRATIGLAYRPIQSVVFSVVGEFNRRLEGDVLIFPRGFPEKTYASLLAGMAFGF